MAASPSPSPDLDLTIGSVLAGRYRIDGLLGSGGMGRVYRGEHTGIGRQVAIKVLHADLTRNREAAARFQREAIASGRLDHPNIVGVSDFGVLDEGGCYLVMEVLDGEPLGARLEHQKRLPWREAVAIMRGVLHGLQHAHERGVVHRDIKPDNVFLAKRDQDLTVKILDFGIAKLYAGSADDPASTRAGLTVGTPAYLSPEQAVGGSITPASDLYSATILFFEMLAGRAPFEEKEPLAMLGAHVSRQPPRIKDVAPEVDLPLGLEDVIQRGLMKAAAERISSATDYLMLLDGIAGAMGIVGDASMIAQVSPALLGIQPTASFTPSPGAIGSPPPVTPKPLATPSAPAPRIPFVPTPPPGLNDQSLIIQVTPGDPRLTSSSGLERAGVATPVPGSLPSPVSAAMPTATLPVAADLSRPTRAGSLADVSDPIPRRWIRMGGIVLAVAVALALVLIASSGDGDAPTGSASIVPMPVLGDQETLRKAALHDLQSGKTCADRRSAISRLKVLGPDKRTIDALRRARYRMRGGVLGVGDDNTNACLKADAEEAIEDLGGSVR
jgi:eukaryotic-like serine/threonine-protein kinase